MSKKIHSEPSPRIEIGAPYDKAIRAILFPKTNTGNLSSDWNVTDWVRYAVAEQLKRAGEVPAECRALLKPFHKDLDL